MIGKVKLLKKWDWKQQKILKRARETAKIKKITS